MPPALAAALRRLLIDELGLLPIPEPICLPPRFHIGTLLLAAGRFAEAEHWLARALDAGIGERGRFLAWRGDALTKLGDAQRAMSAYLAAFLEGPHEVDLVSLFGDDHFHRPLFRLERPGLAAIEAGNLPPVVDRLDGFQIRVRHVVHSRKSFHLADQVERQVGKICCDEGRK